MCALLDYSERHRANQFRFERDHDAFVVARGLLRVILARHAGVDPSEIKFAYSTHGKPFAAGTGRQVLFNLSHSEDFILYAVSTRYRMGIDVERVRPLDEIERIASQFFCPAEYREIMDLPAHMRSKAFFNCWTRKEAFIKALGVGLSLPLNRFQVTLRPGTPARIVTMEGRGGHELRWSLRDLSVAKDYAGALAVDSQDYHLRVSFFEDSAACFDFLHNGG